MNDRFLRDPAWLRAMTLAERAAARRAASIVRSDAAIDAGLAGQRVQRWRSQRPFMDQALFNQRLASDDLTEDEFFSLLGEPVEAVQARCAAAPDWLADLARAFGAEWAPAFPTVAIPEDLNQPELAGFLEIIAPLINQGRERVREGVRTLSVAHVELPFDPDTVEIILFAELPGRLLSMVSRTLALELNVARLQGLLDGETPAQRFQSFVERLRQRETALAMLQEYPVLARQLTLCIEQWVAGSLEFLQRLCADWDDIRAMFCPASEPGTLTRVSSASDRHRGGRTVLLLTFRSGFQLVYKPKSLSVDVHFQELLSWLNERGRHPAFRCLTILDRGQYGWMEFVAARSCTSVEEIRRFYERQGGYLALLYVLAATDFHFENVIAAGDQPLLIDLEALFHPHFGAFDSRRNDQLIAAAVDDSVLSIGLLPQRSWAAGESEGIDISGLGAAGGQLSPFAAPRWQAAGTDEARLTRERMELPQGRHRPTLNGAEVDVLDYTESLVDGFTTMYRLLAHLRDELLSDSGPLARFAGDDVRVLVRPTQSYGLLLGESFHPDLLRDALDRDRFFDRLWVRVAYQPALAHVIPAEHADLLRGDIPLFTTRPGSLDIGSSTGDQIAGLCDESGMSRARRRIQQLSDDDCERQLWLIRASLATLAVNGGRAAGSAGASAASPVPADAGRLLAAARAVGDRLAALAWGDENDVAWIGLMEHGRRWSLESLGLDLYHGLPGIALFLAYLGSVTQEERYTRLARAALQKMRLQIAWGETGIASIGGFEGWGGVIYTLTHLAVLWNEPALLVEAEDVVERLAPLIEEDERLDIIAGAAGCIGSLISLYQCAPSERTLAAAVQCGRRLVARAHPLDRGMGWATLGSSHALAGFAHGAAGIAWALLELSALSGEQDFRTGALAAIDYERSLFAPEYGNWLDLREHIAGSERQGDAPPAFMTAWCHGAPGIGLARLRSLPYLDDATVRAEIAAALRTTLARGCGYTHVLCHGDLGNLEFLLQASRTIADPRLRTEVDRLAATIIASIAQAGWRCATPLEVETPGLMVGLAGIGYGLLRLAAPELVPSVLALEPPPLRDGAAWREALARLRQEQHRAATLIDRAISAAKRPMAYAIRIDLDDAVALQQAARPRREDDYAAERLLLHPYTPPIAVLRQLFYDRHIARVREAVAELGVPDAHLAIIRHPLPGDEWNDERVGMPMHFATAFRYETHIAGRRQSIRVAGPIFISMLHHVLAAHDIPVERKIQAAERVFAEYLKDIDDYDVTVIAIPKRKYQEHSFDVRPDTSLTHTVLLRACRSLVHYREQDDTGYYFLAHAADTGGMMREALFRDARAFDVCAAIRQIWSMKEVRETYEAHYQAQRALVEHLTMPVLSATVGAGAQ